MAKRKNFFQTYRLIPIIAGSLVLFALISAFALLVWSIIAYLTKADVNSAQALPIVLWLTALFVTVCIMTFLTKGGTVFPALFLSIVTVAVSCFFVETSLLTLTGVLTKLGLSLLTAIVAFSVIKLIIQSNSSQRKRSYQQINTDPIPAELQDLDRDPPPAPKSGGKKLF